MKIKQLGFTLIELLVVISIISLLSSIIIVSVDDARQKAQLASVKQNLTSFSTEAQIRKTDLGNYLPTDISDWCQGVLDADDIPTGPLLSAMEEIGEVVDMDNDCFIQYAESPGASLEEYFVLAVDIDDLGEEGQGYCITAGSGNVIEVTQETSILIAEYCDYFTEVHLFP